MLDIIVEIIAYILGPEILECFKAVFNKLLQLCKKLVIKKDVI